MKYVLFVLYSSILYAQPINEQFYESRVLVNVLKDKFSEIRNNYYQTLTLINQKDDKYLKAFQKFDKALGYQQKFASDCNAQAKESCETLLITIMKSLEDFYQVLVPLDEKEVKKLTVETLLKTQLYFIDYVIKRDEMSLLDRYQSIETLKIYFLETFNIMSHQRENKLDNSLFDFWKNFVVQSHFILAEDANLPYFVKNFNILSKSLYGLVYYVQNSEKIDNKVNSRVNIIQNRWNYIQKRLYKP